MVNKTDPSETWWLGMSPQSNFLNFARRPEYFKCHSTGEGTGGPSLLLHMVHTHETIGNPLRWDFSWPSWGHRSWTSDSWQRCVISSEPGNTPLMFPLMTFPHIRSGLRFTVTTSRWRCRSCMHSKRKPRFCCQRNSNSTKQAYQGKLLAESELNKTFWTEDFGTSISLVFSSQRSVTWEFNFHLEI